MGKQRRALGRGLDALIPGQLTQSRDVPLDQIVPGKWQPRTRFDEQALNELADSIHTHGVIQPLIVSPPDSSGKRRLIAGERRWQACKIAGLATVPVVERTVEPGEAMEIALIENLQREDLSPLEEAGAFDRLSKEHGLTQEEIASRIGRSRSSITNTLRLLTLPATVRDPLAAGKISEGHARTLLGLSNPVLMEQVVDRVVKDGLSVRQTEQLVARLREGSRGTRESRPKPAAIIQLESELRNRLGTKVSVTSGRRGGRIVIEYYSEEELLAVSDRLLGSA